MQGNLTTNADFAGRLNISGVWIEFRARLFPNGSANVGTIFTVPK
jgi:hypothetical protein